MRPPQERRAVHLCRRFNPAVIFPQVALAVMLLAGPARATLLWDGNATNGYGVFKLLNLEDENKVEQANPSTNGSYVTTASDPLYGTVWQFHKAVDDLRCEAHGAN